MALSGAPTAWAADGMGTTTGVVVDADRKPVAGMTVRATDVVDPAKSFTGVTDREGRFSIGSLAAGSYLVSADTVNTSWIQKDDSPIVEVSTSASPKVTLVLVRAAELAPVPGGSGSALTALTLGVAGVAAVASIAALLQNNDTQDDLDALRRAQSELQRQLQAARDQLSTIQRQNDEQMNQNADLRHRLEEQAQAIAELEQLLRDVRERIRRLESRSPGL